MLTKSFPMADLSGELKAEIIGEISSFEKHIQEIRSGTRFNRLVCDPDWHHPTVEGNVPFDHERGELVYYSSIRDGLKDALEYGIIPADYECYFRRAPEGIRELVADGHGPFIA